MPCTDFQLPTSLAEDAAAAGSRVFRPINPAYLPNSGAMVRAGSEGFGARVALDGTDCSELATDLYRGAGDGYILRFDPAKRGGLTLFENGAFRPESYYHEVFTDGRYVFDPRLSATPIPKGDYMRFMKGLNKGVTVTTYRP